MKKFLLQLLFLISCGFAEAMTAHAQVTYEPYHFSIFGGLADNPTSPTGARVAEGTRTATGSTSAPTPTPGCVDAWVRTSTINAPTEREYHAAVWTGSEMIVWGGDNGSSSNDFNTGGRYSPGTDSWIMTNTTNAPTSRSNHTAVWTGSEMIIWGGYAVSTSWVRTGGRYNPGTDTWTTTTTTNAPAARGYHTAVWTGSEMIVWGGYNGAELNSGGRYNPSTDTWTGMSTTNAPSGRSFFTAVWTGNEMIVWGGYNGSVDFGTGGRYNPSTDTWTVTSTTNAPTNRSSHTAVWTGNEMIVWGGYDGTSDVNTGGRYNPGTDTWIATSTLNAAEARVYHTAIWTGGEMIVWGGQTSSSFLTTGGRYTPGTGSWTATTADNTPIGRDFYSAVWTGNEMIVWGGLCIKGHTNTGGRYCAQLSATPTPSPTPSTPTPTPTPTPTVSPTATATPRPTPTASPSPPTTVLGNISTRLRVETGDNVLIGGFIITGTQPKKVIVRAIGPSLASFFPGALADPILELRDSSGGLIRSNDNWRSDQEAEIIATGISPSNNLESAIIATLPANNAAYTAIVRGVNNGTGIGVVEAYDLDRTVDSKLANISTRGFVQTGDEVLIGGLIVLGQNPLRVIVRAIGPSLALDGALGDPILELHDGNGALIASNDNWRSDQEAEIIATGIPPSNNLESAIVRNLAPGAYTAIVRGVNNATGIAVVEAYGLN